MTAGTSRRSGVDASDSEGVKHWVNYGIDIAPDATNQVE